MGKHSKPALMYPARSPSPRKSTEEGLFYHDWAPAYAEAIFDDDWERAGVDPRLRRISDNFAQRRRNLRRRARREQVPRVAERGVQIRLDISGRTREDVLRRLTEQEKEDTRRRAAERISIAQRIEDTEILAEGVLKAYETCSEEDAHDPIGQLLRNVAEDIFQLCIDIRRYHDGRMWNLVAVKMYDLGLMRERLRDVATAGIGHLKSYSVAGRARHRENLAKHPGIFQRVAELQRITDKTQTQINAEVAAEFSVSPTTVRNVLKQYRR
jgi:hypothetical protein